ncbi:hypothetical protein [Runella zeae]|uniref:hypothetical protein n=1 Tax=Runella zeae TaxID=94255 RepID=UPI00235774F6|nr:hypothetical protein [Runella zeae]
MLRIAIITQDKFATLGVNALSSFIEAGGTDKINTVQFIDDAFLQLANSMKTYPYGFTEEFKGAFLELLSTHKGQKCLITTHWILKRSSPTADYLMKIVEKINKGHPLTEQEAKKMETIILS